MAPITLSRRRQRHRLVPFSQESASISQPRIAPALDDNDSSTTSRITGRFHASSDQIYKKSTTTPLDIPTRTLLHPRQETTDTVPGHYQGVQSGPAPGTVVGIVLGSVAGFLLLLWLIYTCFQMGGGGRLGDTVSSYGTASVVTRKSRRRQSSRHQQSHHRHSSHRSPRRETVEIRTSRVVPPPSQQAQERERFIVEEEEHMRRRSMSQPPPPGAPPPPMGMPMPMPMPMPRTPPPGHAPRIVSEDEDDEDEVVVIEEHTPPRRRKSQSRSRARRSSSAARRESGFREVDPDRFAGGNASFRDVRRSSRQGR